MRIRLKCKREGQIVNYSIVALTGQRRDDQERLGKRVLNLLQVIGPPYSSIDVSLIKEPNEKLTAPKRQVD